MVLSSAGVRGGLLLKTDVEEALAAVILAAGDAAPPRRPEVHLLPLPTDGTARGGYRLVSCACLTSPHSRAIVPGGGNTPRTGPALRFSRFKLTQPARLLSVAFGEKRVVACGIDCETMVPK
jgi:hypothetical protein